jgi:hypothetical protein
LKKAEVEMPKVLEKRLIKAFKDKESFTREELFHFFHSFEPDLNEGTFGWRIFDLKNRNIIKPVRRGLYVISYKPKFRPELSTDLLKITKHLSAKFDEVKLCVWETAWLNEFTQHQLAHSALIIEVEKGFEESVFYTLKDNKYREVYVNPEEKDIGFYIAESKQPIIIKKLLTRAPLIKRAENKGIIYTPSLEKILVDIFAEEPLFYYLRGSELIHIYENALEKYTINFTKLFSYAKRRERETEIKQFLIHHMFHLVKDIIHD